MLLERFDMVRDPVDTVRKGFVADIRELGYYIGKDIYRYPVNK